MYEALHCTNDILKKFMILIDGKKEAALLREELKKEVSELKATNQLIITLAITI